MHNLSYLYTHRKGARVAGRPSGHQAFSEAPLVAITS